MKIKEIIELYNAIKNAKLTKLSTSEKVQIIKTASTLSPIAAQWDEFIKTVYDKCKGENHDAYMSDLQQWQHEGEKTTLSIERRIAISQYMNKYNEETEKIINERKNEDVSLDLCQIDEEAFNKLIDSNEFDIETAMPIYTAIVKK